MMQQDPPSSKAAWEAEDAWTLQPSPGGLEENQCGGADAELALNCNCEGHLDPPVGAKCLTESFFRFAALA